MLQASTASSTSRQSVLAALDVSEYRYSVDIPAGTSPESLAAFGFGPIRTHGVRSRSYQYPLFLVTVYCSLPSTLDTTTETDTRRLFSLGTAAAEGKSHSGGLQQAKLVSELHGHGRQRNRPK